jgi:rubrerythrin
MNPLEFAIQLENEGESFYTQQAATFQETDLGTVFRILAAAEKKHAALIAAHLAGETADWPDGRDLDAARSIFPGLPALRQQLAGMPDQMDVYTLASGIEQRSIDLYSELLRTAQDSGERVLLDFILKQEQDHLALFEELSFLLSRPKEWVEAAEFGPREEY